MAKGISMMSNILIIVVVTITHDFILLKKIVSSYSTLLLPTSEYL